MKKVLSWIEEEKAVILVLLLAIGVILNDMPAHYMLGGILIYGTLLIVIFHLAHRLIIKFVKKR